MLNELFDLTKDKLLFHLSLEKEVKFATERMDLLFNPKEESWSSFYSKLKKYNKTGYNIYLAINWFQWKRRRKANIEKFRGFMIDLDGTDKEQTYLNLVKNSYKTKANFNIFPNYVIETYKGFHVIFAFHQDIHFLKEEIYLSFFQFINEIYNWDKRFKPITGMMKVPWFIDHKDWRNYPIKENDFKTSPNRIDLEQLSSIFSVAGNEKKKFLKLENEIKIDEEAMIESIDAKELIKVLNKNYMEWVQWFNKPIKISKDKVSINDTNWLKLFYNKEEKKYTFKDFAEKWRYGILWFLWNYYFEFYKKDFPAAKKFLEEFIYNNFQIIVAYNDIKHFEKFCVKKEKTKIKQSQKNKKLIPQFPLQQFANKKIKWWDGNVVKLSTFQKYLKIFDLRRVNINSAIRCSKEEFTSLLGEIWEVYVEDNSWVKVIKSHESVFNMKIETKKNEYVNLITYYKSWEFYNVKFYIKNILSKKSMQILISDNLYNYILSIRSYEKVAFLLDILMGYENYGTLTYKLWWVFKNQKYYYQILKESGILNDIPNYKILWKYLYVWRNEWLETLKNVD